MALMLKPLKHKFSYGGIIDRLCGARKAPESLADVLLALSNEELEKLQKEKQRQLAVLQIKRRFGKNAIVKGMNLQEGATAMERNQQIGGHKA